MFDPNYLNEIDLTQYPIAEPSEVKVGTMLFSKLQKGRAILIVESITYLNKWKENEYKVCVVFSSCNFYKVGETYYLYEYDLWHERIITA